MFGDNDHTREDEYDRFLHDKVLQAKEDFHSLLCETKSITYKSKDTIRESDKHLKDIIDTLEKDQRYLILEYIKDERHQILMDYIDGLHQKGPPPPPTATHPSERVRK
jgi:transcription elongation regulator 1